MADDHEFCDACEGCRPALLDAFTLRPLPPDDPFVIAANKVWDTRTTFAQRRAFVLVTLRDSENESEKRLCAEVVKMMHAAVDLRDSPQD